jgi:hypothetical protein
MMAKFSKRPATAPPGASSSSAAAAPAPTYAPTTGSHPAAVPTNGHARGIADFRHESLSDTEIVEIQRHVEGIRHILNQARNRRRKRATLEAATAFVGVCVAPLSGQTLPDHPIYTGGGNGLA